MTPISRRNFLSSTAAASAAAFAPHAKARASQQQLPSAVAALQPLGDRIHPIAHEEFHKRFLRAQSLLQQQQPACDAILIGPGTSLY